MMARNCMVRIMSQKYTKRTVFFLNYSMVTNYTAKIDALKLSVYQFPSPFLENSNIAGTCAYLAIYDVLDYK